MNNEELTMNNELDDELDLTDLGSALLSFEKGANEELSDKFYTLDFFASIDNQATKENMICFSVEEIEGKYFWASATLYNVLRRNIVKASEDTDARAYYFPKHKMMIKHCGKTPLKNDPQKSCNNWKIEVSKI